MTRGRKMFVGLTALLVALLLSACGAGTGGGADTTKPVITLLGRATVALSVGDTYTDAGATATDDTDGNITDKIVVNNPVNTAVAGTYTVTYDVNDSAGNAADQVTRTVTVSDTTKPVITLKGNATVVVNIGDTYTDAGATANDNVDGDITDRIVVNNPVNTAVAGTYTVTYDVNDSAGNAADQVTRTVRVNQPPTADAGADQTGYTGDPITLDGSASSDPDGTIASYEWKEGATLLSTNDVFSKNDFTYGEHNITLTVTDNDGATASDNVTVTIYEMLKKTGQTKIYDAGGTEHNRTEADVNASLRDDGYYQKGVDCNYTRDNVNEIVTDHITGLQWQDDVNASSIQKNWADAQAYCTTELALGGFTDWRLPTIDELMYIADRSKHDPAIDTTVFLHTSLSFYWSSTSFVDDESNAWNVRFTDGVIYRYVKSNSYYVRCVRSGE